VARVLQVGHVSPSRLAARLTAICARQRIQTDARALMALCELADNDIRSCLNTLQFMQAQAKFKLQQEQQGQC
jgi:chromosome transmission fidelity protein 18